MDKFPCRVKCIDHAFSTRIHAPGLVFGNIYTAISITESAGKKFFSLLEVPCIWSADRFEVYHSCKPIIFPVREVNSSFTDENLREALTKKFANCTFSGEQKATSTKVMCQAINPVPGFTSIRELKIAIQSFAEGYVMALP